MKLRTFIISATLSILIAGGIIWNIIDNYYEHRELTKATSLETLPQVVMYKNQGCQCCDRWADHLRTNGFRVDIRKSGNISEVKQKYDIPPRSQACHTALVGDYVVEGHVPADDIKSLLALRPDATGLTVPGMPASSPGMNTAPNQPYNVYLLKEDGSHMLFAKH